MDVSGIGGDKTLRDLRIGEIAGRTYEPGFSRLGKPSGPNTAFYLFRNKESLMEWAIHRAPAVPQGYYLPLEGVRVLPYESARLGLRRDGSQVSGS